MSKTAESNESKMPPITSVTEGVFNDVPSLSVPTGNPTRPVTMTLGRWRHVLKHHDAIAAFCEKHKGFDLVTKGRAPAPVKIPDTAEGREAMKLELLAKLAALGASVA